MFNTIKIRTIIHPSIPSTSLEGYNLNVLTRLFISCVHYKWKVFLLLMLLLLLLLLLVFVFCNKFFKLYGFFSFVFICWHLFLKKNPLHFVAPVNLALSEYCRDINNRIINQFVNKGKQPGVTNIIRIYIFNRINDF